MDNLHSHGRTAEVTRPPEALAFTVARTSAHTPLPAGVRARRCLDVVLALVMIVLTTPVMIVAIVAIRLGSPGPALFTQRRLGRGGRPFTVFKLRTMRVDADSAPHRRYVHELISGDAPTEQRDGLYKLAADSRVTRAGRVLRRFSLDEIPQLLNVVRGEMALVGPRPVIPYETDSYPDWYFERFAVKPGITGLWQVSGRNLRTYEEMVAYDVEYVSRASLATDVWILWRTIGVVLRREGVA